MHQLKVLIDACQHYEQNWKAAALKFALNALKLTLNMEQFNIFQTFCLHRLYQLVMSIVNAHGYNDAVKKVRDQGPDSQKIF